MNFNELTDEQKIRARAAKTPEEILALAKEEGYELSDEQLEDVAGGGWCAITDCSDNTSDDTCSMHGCVTF